MKFPALLLSLAVSAHAADPSDLASRWELFVDEFDAPALDVSALKGKPVSLRISLKDADLYALRFAD